MKITVIYVQISMNKLSVSIHEADNILLVNLMFVMHFNDDYNEHDLEGGFSLKFHAVKMVKTMIMHLPFSHLKKAVSTGFRYLYSITLFFME
jgi:hypothetical protein